MTDPEHQHPLQVHRLWRLARRSATSTVIALAVVVVLATVLALGSSKAISALTTSSPTTTTTGSTTTSTSTPLGSPGAPIGAVSPSENNAPTIPISGGALPGHGAFDAISCPSTTECVAVGTDDNDVGVASVSSNEGSSWTNGSVPANVSDLYGVTCTGAQSCVAVGRGAIITTSDGGQTWALKLPPAQTTLLGVTCTSAGICLSAGIAPNPAGPYVGVILRSSDNGSTWSIVNLPQSTPGLEAITCDGPSTCIAVGAAVLVSTDSGQTWANLPVTGGIGNLESVACATSMGCLAIGANPVTPITSTSAPYAIATSNGGTSWADTTLPGGDPGLHKVVCPSTTQCVAAGSVGQGAGTSAMAYSSDGGNTWTLGAGPSQISSVAALSCPAPGTCVVVGRSGNHGASASSTNGTNWAVTPLPY